MVSEFHADGWDVHVVIDVDRARDGRQIGLQCILDLRDKESSRSFGPDGATSW